MRLAGRKALVTGASRGIGRAIALSFATEGADVAINYLHSDSAAKQLVKEIQAMGCEVISDPGVIPVKFRDPGGTIAELVEIGRYTQLGR